MIKGGRAGGKDGGRQAGGEGGKGILEASDEVRASSKE